MKKIKLIIWLFILMKKGLAQSDTIKWQNNRYTLLNELGKVWIEQYKGSVIKDVKIHYIDTAKGKIEYLREGTLHDLFIYNIKKITPGKYYNQSIKFIGNIPVIYINSSDIEYNTYKSHEFQKQTKTTVSSQQINATSITSEISASKKEEMATDPLANARIIFENGKYIDVKLISLNNEQVSYKRLDLLSGPLYVFELTIPGTLKLAKVTRKNGFTIVDYSK